MSTRDKKNEFEEISEFSDFYSKQQTLSSGRDQNLFNGHSQPVPHSAVIDSWLDLKLERNSNALETGLYKKILDLMRLRVRIELEFEEKIIFIFI